MSVIDSSAVVDVLIGEGVAPEATRIMGARSRVFAPDVLVFEVLAALRRLSLRGEIPADRAAGAVTDLGALPIRLVPSLGLRTRAWELRDAITAGDGLFVALAETLDQPLVTKDGALARGMHGRSPAQVILLEGG